MEDRLHDALVNQHSALVSEHIDLVVQISPSERHAKQHRSMDVHQSEISTR